MWITKNIGEYLFIISTIQFFPLVFIITSAELILFNLASIFTKYNLVETHPAHWFRPTLKFFYTISMKLAGVNCLTTVSVILTSQRSSPKNPIYSSTPMLHSLTF